MDIESSLSILIPLGLVVGGIVVSVMCYSIVIIGKSIDNMNTTNSGGAPQWSKPSTATKLASIAILALYLAGSLGILFAGASKITMVLGIAAIAAAVLTAFTAIAFSSAVIQAKQLGRFFIV